MGARREHNELQFPHMRRPTNIEWSEWKSFICRNFLRGPYIIAFTIGKMQGYPQYDKNLTEIKKLQQMKIESTLEATMRNLPTSFSQLLGLPTDNGEYLAKMLT